MGFLSGSWLLSKDAILCLVLKLELSLTGFLEKIIVNKGNNVILKEKWQSVQKII